jgi:hypothetical protein
MQGGQCHVAGEGTMAALIGRAASVLGISDGPVVGEIVIHQGVTYVTEISARLGNSELAADAARLALGE